MNIICDFENIQEMAHAVGDSANAVEKQKYTLQPWNRFRPENTIWWLVPSTEWPAYAYGKGVVCPGGVLAPEQVFCGIHIEKGFAPLTAEVYPALRQRSLLLEPHWTWFEFLKSLQDGRVAQIAQAISQNSNLAVIIEIATWYTMDPTDFDPYALSKEDGESECRSSIDGGQVWFSLDGDQLKKLKELCIQDVTRPVAACQSLAELAQAVEHTKDMAWSWLDFSIGTKVSFKKDYRGPGQNWDANDIWDKLIRPWGQWII